MAEMVGHSCSLPRKQGLLTGILVRISAVWPKRSARIRTDEWPDYLLRDVGLSSAERDPINPRDWPLR